MTTPGPIPSPQPGAKPVPPSQMPPKVETPKPGIVLPGTPPKDGKPGNEMPDQVLKRKQEEAAPKAEASGGATVRTLHRNPPFSKEIMSLTDLSTGGNLDLQRGFIKTDENALTGGVAPGLGKVFYLFFLYNPSVINLSHVVDAQTSVYRRTEDVMTQRMRPMQQTLSFALLFDRLYDVMKPTELDSRFQGARMSDLGVYADVLTLYDMLGVTKKLQKADASKDVAEGSEELAPIYNSSTGEFGKDYAMRPVGPMLYTACRFYFSKQLIFRGIISGVDVSYTHWTAAMVPNRCTINVNVELLPEIDEVVDPQRVAQEAYNLGGDFRRAASYIASPLSITNGKWRYTPGGGGIQFD